MLDLCNKLYIDGLVATRALKKNFLSILRVHNSNINQKQQTQFATYLTIHEKLTENTADGLNLIM
jgi:hypothetical protein